eukprot:Amastigsp_a42029_4.p3 type:complete len:142 gc:universal Amastigsp_a42029_4:450-25(-)
MGTLESWTQAQVLRPRAKLWRNESARHRTIMLCSASTCVRLRATFEARTASLCLCSIRTRAATTSSLRDSKRLGTLSRATTPRRPTTPGSFLHAWPAPSRNSQNRAWPSRLHTPSACVPLTRRSSANAPQSARRSCVRTRF